MTLRDNDRAGGLGMAKTKTNNTKGYKGLVVVESHDRTCPKGTRNEKKK